MRLKRPKLQTATAAVLSVYATHLLLVICGVVTGSISAVGLLPEGRGILAASLLWPTIIMHGGLLGIHFGFIGIMRDPLTRNPEDVASAVLQLSMALSVWWCLALALVLPYINSAQWLKIRDPALLALLIVPAGATLTVLQAIMQARGDFGAYNRSRLVQSLSYTAIVIAAWLTIPVSPSTFVLAMLASQAAGIALAFSGNAGLLSRLPDFRLFVSILTKSAPFSLIIALDLLAVNIGTMVTLSLLTHVDAGIFAVSLLLAGAMITFGASVTTVLFSKFSGTSNLDHLASRGFRQVAFASVILYGVFALAVPIFIILVLGHSYYPSILVSLLLGAGIAFKSPFDVLDTMMRSQGMTAQTIIARIVGVTITAFGGIAVHQRFGIVGIAACSAVGYVAMSLVVLYASLQRLDIRLRELNPFRLDEIRAIFGLLRGIFLSTRSDDDRSGKA